MKSILFYHIYLLNNWKAVTDQLLKNIPHDTIIVNVSYDLRYIYKLPLVYLYLRKNPKVKHIFFTANDAKYGEILGFDKMRKRINLDDYNILTYMHAKGVTRVNNQKVAQWRELLRYFIVDRFDLCIEAFQKGYALYGANLYQYKPEDGPRQRVALHTDFWFRGNFASLNLDLLRDKFTQIEVKQNYFSVEGFWGQLCDADLVYCPHDSQVNHYETAYPENLYKGTQITIKP